MYHNTLCLAAVYIGDVAKHIAASLREYDADAVLAALLSEVA